MTLSVLSPEFFYLLVSQKKLSEVLANNSEWLKCYLTQSVTYVKGRHNVPEIINVFVICVNLQKFT